MLQHIAMYLVIDDLVAWCQTCDAVNNQIGRDDSFWLVYYRTNYSSCYTVKQRCIIALADAGPKLKRRCLKLQWAVERRRLYVLKYNLNHKLDWLYQVQHENIVLLTYMYNTNSEMRQLVCQKLSLPDVDWNSNMMTYLHRGYNFSRTAVKDLSPVLGQEFRNNINELAAIYNNTSTTTEVAAFRVKLVLKADAVNVYNATPARHNQATRILAVHYKARRIYAVAAEPNFNVHTLDIINDLYRVIPTCNTLKPRAWAYIARLISDETLSMICKLIHLMSGVNNMCFMTGLYRYVAHWLPYNVVLDMICIAFSDHTYDWHRHLIQAILPCTHRGGWEEQRLVAAYFKRPSDNIFIHTYMSLLQHSLLTGDKFDYTMYETDSMDSDDKYVEIPGFMAGKTECTGWTVEVWRTIVYINSEYDFKIKYGTQRYKGREVYLLPKFVGIIKFQYSARVIVTGMVNNDMGALPAGVFLG